MSDPIDSQDEPLTALEKVKAYWTLLDESNEQNEPWWDNILYEYITPISAFRHDSASSSASGSPLPEDEDAASAPPGTCTALYILTVPQSLCNRMGNLHGGAVATIIDVCTSVAIAPVIRDDFWLSSGVSRSLSATYLKAIRQGSRVVVACDVVGLGARLGFMRARIRAVKPHLLEGVQGHGRSLTGIQEGLTEAQLCHGPVLCVGEHGKVNTDQPKRRSRANAGRSNL